MADPRVKELAYQALVSSFQSPNLGFESITDIDMAPSATPDVPSPVQEFTRAATPTIGPFEPTMRQRLGAGAQQGLEALGMRRPQARSVSQSIFGGPSSALPVDLGVADVVPFLGTAMQTQEAARSLGRAGQLAGQGEYGQAAIETGMGILGLVPGAVGTVQAARPIARQLSSTPPIGSIQIDQAMPAARSDVVSPIEQARQMAPRSPIGFYSAVEETVANIPQAKGTGDQFLAQIQKTAGVKPDEIKYTGLDDFLKGKKSVTKQEIQDYLSANRVDVQEVRLSDEIDPEEVRAFMADEAGEGFTYDEALDYLRDGDSVTKFSKLTLPGGENYRELLLTLPQRTEPFDPSKVKIYRNRTSATQGTFSIMYGDNAVGPFADKFDIADNYAGLSDQQIMDVAKKMYEQGNELSGIKPMSGSFKSSHFDQPNILAHLRVNDRTVDGKKTLFVEEIQSDWHQAGRKKGYDTPEARAAEQQRLDNILVERQALLDERLRLEELAQPYTSQGKDAPPEIVEKWSIVSNRLNNLQTEQNRLGRGFGQQVPDAPFKTSWHELSLKRAIQEAAEKGYDQIAFTTGKTQAERYDLSKQVDSIVYLKENDGTYSLVAIKDGRELVKRDNVAQSALPDLVGKEVADRMAASEGQAIPGGPERELSGENLRVGGEGMKGFYDNILPKSLDKLGKKFGAKVGKTFIEGERTRDADGFPSMYPEKIEVWKMDITPQMRESVTTKGQPLFQIGVGAGAGGIAAMQGKEEVQ